MLAASTASAPPMRDAVGQVLQAADAAGGDHRDRRPRRDTARVSAQVEAALGAVAVHAGQQDLAGAQRCHLARPLDRVEPGGVRPPWV